MEYASEELRIFRIGIAAAIITIVGTLLSGPLAFLAVSSIQPQPAWSGAQTYVANYHPVQSITFYFGFLLLFGSVLMIASIYLLDNKGSKSLLALLFTSIACGLIAFNYFTQATYIPALIRNYTHTLDPIITMFAVTNPYSLFWAIEMWGYGFLGLGTLFASNFFSGHGIEKATKTIFMANGIVSLLGVLIISIRLEWVLSISGLVSYAAWNILYIALAVLYLIVIIQRRGKGKRIQTFAPVSQTGLGS